MHTEAQLLNLHSAWDSAYSDGDPAALYALLAEEASLWGDGVILPDHAKGDDVLKAFSSYFASYNVSHSGLLMEAVDVGGQVVFGFWEDSIIEAEGAAQEGGTGGGAGSVLGFWKLAFDQRGRLKEVWLLRQPTKLERESKGLPQVERVSYDPQAASQHKVQLSKEQLQKMREAVGKYNEMWMLREAELAWKILSPDYLDRDFISGRSMKGPAAVADMVFKMPSNWTLEDSKLDMAYVEGTNKMMAHWAHTGRMGDSPLTVWGLGFLAFKPDSLLLEHDFSSMNCWNEQMGASE